jgi:hypothetical protein
MDAPLLGWTLLGLFRPRLWWGVQHALDHLVATARDFLVAVLIIKTSFAHG